VTRTFLMAALSAFATIAAWAFLAAICLAVAGCAGHKAMQWRKPQPYVEPCPIRVCEKVSPRDKHCWREYCANSL